MDAINVEGMSFGSNLVGLGALIATGTVVLASILGISRLAYIMAHDGVLPAFMSRIDPKTSSPRNAIILSGAGILLLAVFVDLPHIAYISSFSLLLYYAAIDLSGLKVFSGRMKYVTLLGLLSCLVLMFSLPYLSWLVGFVVVVVGGLYHTFFLKRAIS